MAKTFLRFIRLGILGNRTENIRFSAKVDFTRLYWEESKIPLGATTLPLFLMKGKKLQIDQTELRKAINLEF